MIPQRRSNRTAEATEHPNPGVISRLHTSRHQSIPDVLRAMSDYVCAIYAPPRCAMPAPGTPTRVLPLRSLAIRSTLPLTSTHASTASTSPTAHHPHDSVALTTSAFELLSTRLPGCNSASHLGAQPSTARSEVSSEVSTCDDDPRVQSRVRLDTVLELRIMAISPTHCARVAPCKRLKLEGGSEKSCVFLINLKQTTYT